ncbi:hypothetical protein FH972_006817 [Carpinus fangiana]|uniref:Uncharacterized protein n=1 Tax=Carpinus fangiana TaxID=176857 RepID=A0A5N6QUH4_9ROSI|nr:hypothetical protein FH972_006817 [Carpinus fangiana]
MGGSRRYQNMVQKDDKASSSFWRAEMGEREGDLVAGSSKASKVDASPAVPQQEVASFVVEEGDDAGVPSTEEAVGGIWDLGLTQTRPKVLLMPAGREFRQKNKLESLGLT